MNNKELVEKLIHIAKDVKTLYVLGCFGSPLNFENKKRFTSNVPYNAESVRREKILDATGDTFGFDCACLIKSALWGFNEDIKDRYGGAKYASNGVPDIDADTMIQKCSNISTDFSKIEPGEAVWIKGHIGVYIGDGLVVECTPNWKDGVQITACNRNIAGYKRRNWIKHGKLPYITYDGYSKKKLESGNDIVWELMNGKLKIKINEVQRAVNALDRAKSNKEFESLYWILYKLVNGSD